MPDKVVHGSSPVFPQIPHSDPPVQPPRQHPPRVEQADHGYPRPLLGHLGDLAGGAVHVILTEDEDLVRLTVRFLICGEGKYAMRQILFPPNFKISLLSTVAAAKCPES